MNKSVSNFLNGLLFGMGVVIILFISIKSYALLSNVNDGDTLTKDKWNELVNTVNNLNTNTGPKAYVSFVGTNCSGGAGNECVINSSFNVSKVIRSSTGTYIIYFSNSLANNQFVTVIGGYNNGTGNGGWNSYRDKTTNSVEIYCYSYAGAFQDQVGIDLVVY